MTEISYPKDKYITSKRSKKYSFGIYAQHKNGMFYLKRVGKVADYQQSKGLFGVLGYFVVRLNKEYTTKQTRFLICMFDIPYTERNLEFMPGIMNPYGLIKKKNEKRKVYKKLKEKKLFNF